MSKKYYVYGVVAAQLQVNASSAQEARAIATRFVWERCPNFVIKGSKEPVASSIFKLIDAVTQRK